MVLLLELRMYTLVLTPSNISHEEPQCYLHLLHNILGHHADTKQGLLNEVEFLLA